MSSTQLRRYHKSQLRPPSVHDLLTDSSATWGGSVSPPVALLPDGAGHDREPSRQASDRSGSSMQEHRF
eukprot:scaffold7887_cov52-Phaeocystis_antarctica.AAC.3